MNATGKTCEGTSDNSSLNTPLRGFKGQVFEGGIRVPFTMQWKGHIPAGKAYHEMVMGFDCHATALGSAGVESRIGIQPVSGDQERNAGEASDGQLDGVNLIPYLTGQQPAIFKDVDKDNDGFATREEIQTYYASRRNSGTPNQ